LPASVLGLKEDLFSGCERLQAITVDPAHPDYSSLDGMVYDKEQGVLLICPPGKSGLIVIRSRTSSVKATFKGCAGVTAFSVEAANPAYCSRDGLLLERDGLGSVLIRCPPARSGAVTVPADILDMENGAFDGCDGVTELLVAPSHTAFSSIDGVLYDRDASTAICCPAGRAGPVSMPETVIDFCSNSFSGCDRVTAIHVDDDNPVYCSYDGVLYTKDLTQLLKCPSGKEGVCRLSSAVNNLTFNCWLFYGCCGVTAFEIGEESPFYACQDGVLFDKDKERILFCPSGKSGAFRVPASVTGINEDAFAASLKLDGLVVPLRRSTVNAMGHCIYTGAVRYEE
jgi:hypothetical protein